MDSNQMTDERNKWREGKRNWRKVLKQSQTTKQMLEQVKRIHHSYAQC